jgi:hypothetical protein
MEITKYCSKCDTTKPIEQFCKTKRSADGYAYTCKSCIKEYQVANKEKLKAYQREYQIQYKAEHKEELYQYIRNWQQANPEKTRASVAACKAKNPEHYKAYSREWARKDRLRKKLAKQQQQSND